MRNWSSSAAQWNMNNPFQVTSRLCAASRMSPHGSVSRLTLERRGRARMTLNARLLHASREMGSFVGDFVALAPSGSRP